MYEIFRRTFSVYRQSFQSVVDLLFFENITDRIINGLLKIHTKLSYPESHSTKTFIGEQ